MFHGGTVSAPVLWRYIGIHWALVVLAGRTMSNFGTTQSSCLGANRKGALIIIKQGSGTLRIYYICRRRAHELNNLIWPAALSRDLDSRRDDLFSSQKGLVALGFSAFFIDFSKLHTQVLFGDSDAAENHVFKALCTIYRGYPCLSDIFLSNHRF